MFFRILAISMLAVGVFMLVQIAMPLLSYKLWEVSAYNQNMVLADPSGDRGEVMGVSVENVNSFPALVSNNHREVNVGYSEFSITIPSINLAKAIVKVDSNDFEQQLAHLPGSALPGERGNSFITGHSSLNQLFTQNNYKAIFANLPKIKKGDDILVIAGGTHYSYKVTGVRVVDPKETWVVDPPDDSGRYLSLMTCVPPGLQTKRLIVLAKLAN